MWWLKGSNVLEPLKERLNKRREMCEQNSVNNLIERLIVDDYIKITYDTKKYLLNTNARRLRRVIYDYLAIFDFVNAFYYMEEYIRRKYWNYKKYQRMKRDLEKLIKQIKIRLAKREDIIVFWTDNVSYNELEWMPKLQKKSKDSLFFENAYTPTPYTRPTMCAMANKWLDIDDFGKDDLRNLNSHNSILLRKIYEYGFEAKYFDVGPGNGPCVFDKSIQHWTDRWHDSTCRICFDAINELLNTEKKQVMIIHAVMEVHPPHIYPDKHGQIPHMQMDYKRGELERKRGRGYQQIRNAAEYWDEQLDFYSGLLGEFTTKIHMSDHGKVGGKGGRRYKEWVESKNHVFFFLQSKYVKSKLEKRLFTLESFAELMEEVMKAHQTGQEINLEKVLKKPFMKVQKIDTYNEILVKFLKAVHCEECGQSYRGIRTLEDYYLRFRDHELYYRNGDEETNLIDDPKYADRIEELRALAGDYFIDISKNEKFKYARELYH
ncbi:MAG: hypothetical protein HDQ98_09080 [Lachnospiraceae bacterium]|nr:hypothetical protein [Lachnospiraceae bacterium]